ncbi:MAG TPA: VWA domain-containing protein [Pyrinomonadaceae bacterium]|nr:VWA domain-containing protein [Pyrinomonadaceae bacterium]
MNTLACPRERKARGGLVKRLRARGLLLLFGLAILAPLAAFSQTDTARRTSSSTDVRAAAWQQSAQPQTAATPGVSSLPAPSPTPYTRQRIVSPKPAPTSVEPENNAAEATADETVDENEVVRVTSNLVLVPASVVDARGRAITDLKLQDFELRVDGQVKPISDLSRAETPVHVALLFDNSASLSAARAFELQAAMRFFRNVVRPIDRAAIYSISTLPVLEQSFTNDVPRLMRTIERFGKPEGATALFDSITQAANYLRPVPGRKVIVLVSDGTDTVSDINFEEALQRTLVADCQVYVVQTRQIEDPNLHDPVSEGQLAKLTEQTGGAVFAPRALEELDNAFTQISLDLAQQYVLSYSPEDDRKDKYFRFISLRVKTRPNLRVRARRGFYPTTAQNDAALPYENGAADGRKPGDASGQAASRPAQTAPHGGNNFSVSYNESPVALNGREQQGRAGSDRATGRKPGPEDVDNEDARANNVASAAPERAVKSVTLQQPAPDQARTSAPPAASSSNTQAPVSSTTQEPKPTPAPAQKAPATAAEATKQKVPVSGGVLNSKATNLPKPLYPQTAKSAGASGKVIVEVTIDEKGKVIEARASSGHPLLQAAAASAARQARFSPTLLSGEAVKVKGTIVYTFVWP